MKMSMSETASPRGKPPGRYHHGNLRPALLETTLEMIDREGLSSVSLRAVARRLGVSDAALYHHFPTKEALLAALAAEAYASLHEVVERAADAAGSDPFDRLDAVMRAYVSFGRENRGRYRVLFGEHALAFSRHPATVAAGRGSYEFFAATVTACTALARRDAVDTTRACWALMHGLVTLILEREIRFDDPADGVHTAQSLVDTAVGTFLRDIRAGAARATAPVEGRPGHERPQRRHQRRSE
jgi:AcrR family transcriptional regulator